ncbi:sulfate transport system permease protein CysW [Candidatus Phycosocius bacilliformis]|uniref:Sulfate transport system permease protein CysW n=1 Tax=Candidatus Phycosocius bacilliformis TaxID=1445552 RepID=A0A2P2EBA5_9PROT|nr:iron ABC transporter permease [Candidatus Phycosocius bacilliformis]GBF58323.1 sulfate transport system permease protein CysW [Candidatus Phycosocius bacilliformis]
MSILDPGAKFAPLQAWQGARLSASKLKTWLVALLIGAVIVAVPGLPVAFTLMAAWQPSSSFEHIADVLLWDMAWTSLGLLVLATTLATVVGVQTAWVVTAYHFWGRQTLSWALALPLAMPAYVAAYAWGDLIGARGFWVALLVYASTLYPYVYLAARSAFEAQSVCALEAARLLGATPWRRFAKVALPLARPAIAAGAALTGLEIAADYGAADHLGVSTLTIGVFRAWFSMGDLAGAARLASLLLLGVLILVWLERHARKGLIAGGSTRWRTPPRAQLSFAKQALMFGACLIVLGIGLVIPVSHLAWLAIANGVPERALGQPIIATASLCALGALVTLALAGISAFVGQSGRRASQFVHAASLAGYATPGAVTALGILAALSLSGHQIAAALSGPLAIVALCYAYAARFSAAGLEPLSAGLEKSTRSMRESASTLGASRWSRFLRLEAPLAAPSAFAAALIVAVEIAKELPATTILRPFGFDTLAVRAHAYAADERLGAAAWPALTIVALALIPTLIFSHGLSKSRAGQS